MNWRTSLADELLDDLTSVGKGVPRAITLTKGTEAMEFVAFRSPVTKLVSLAVFESDPSLLDSFFSSPSESEEHDFVFKGSVTLFWAKQKLHQLLQEGYQASETHSPSEFTQNTIRKRLHEF